MKRAAEDGLLVLRGFSPKEMQALVVDSMERVLQPLVYAESLDLVELHRSRGEPVYIVSATLQEIVQVIADDLGFDGALGTICEVEDGKYTGRAIRPLHAENKARCIRELDYDLDREHGVLRQPHGSPVPRGGRASGRRQPGSPAAAHRGAARLARARVRTPCSVTRA